jgi:putative membrane protein
MQASRLADYGSAFLLESLILESLIPLAAFESESSLQWPPGQWSRHPYTRSKVMRRIMRRTAFGRSRDHDVLKGMASGAIGGLVASWTMNQFQKGWSKASQAWEQKRHPEQSQPEEQQQQSDSDSEDATMRTAEWIAEGVLHRPLAKEQRKKLGPVVHYSFGTLMGALYGTISEVMPRATAADGVLFGTALFAGADELSLWALHLAGPPTQYPISTHAHALASHCVYGVTTETVRRAIRHVW